MMKPFYFALSLENDGKRPQATTPNSGIGTKDDPMSYGKAMDWAKTYLANHPQCPGVVVLGSKEYVTRETPPIRSYHIDVDGTQEDFKDI